MSKTLQLLYQNLEYLSDKGKIELPHYKLDKYRDGDSKLGVEKLIKLADSSGYTIDSLLYKDLKASESIDPNSIKLLVLDCDGVLTDAGMNLTEYGDEIKRFNAKDGMAIKRSQKKGIQTAIISNGSNKKAISHRAKMLGIEKVYVGKDNKMDILNAWLEDLNLNLSEVAYVGDDLNDIPVMQKVAFSACPSDAATDVKKVANVNLSQKGGYGCVREFIEKYLVDSLTD